VSAGPRRRFIVPEVVQTSAMDCGPAALGSLLEGFGIHAHQGRLREACQTDVDGTSIDTLEVVARELGLDAEQVLLPPEHVLLPAGDSLPALLVVVHADGYPHFVVAWRRVGPWVMVMDPATGRRWTLARQLERELYQHTMPFPADDWRDWAGTRGFLDPLAARAKAVGVDEAGFALLRERALADPGWRALATLDASVRMATALVASKGVRRGAVAARILAGIFERGLAAQPGAVDAIPERYYTVWKPSSGGQADQLAMRGAVLVRALGVRHDAIDRADAPDPATARRLKAVLGTPPLRPAKELFRLLVGEGSLPLVVVVAALALAAVGAVVEALLFRGLLDLGAWLGVTGQRAGLVLGLLTFLLAMLALQVPLAATLFRTGRRIEGGLRLAVLRKIPRLLDGYFRSRLTSDLAHRAHAVHLLRQLPWTGARIWLGLCGILATGVGICWLDPWLTPLVMLAALVSLGAPLALLPVVNDQDARVRTHAGGLARFSLDALLGLVPLRTHGAEAAVRREHEALLVEWARSSLRFHRIAVGAMGLQILVGTLVAGGLLVAHLHHAEGLGAVLLLVYWALRMPDLGQEVAAAIRQYPAQRNTTMRLYEPLGAPELPAPEPPEASGPSAGGVAFELRALTVRAGGHTLLDSVELSIPAGQHVALLGRSGAGKSSLVSTLLGFHEPSSGALLMDDEPLTPATLAALRQQVAWVDPTVQLWNRPVLDNLLYGAAGGGDLGAVLRDVELLDLLGTLPAGLQSSVGEGGGSLSGGEGQRLRLGRALSRSAPRLVLLDEAFRGLDRAARLRLLGRCRERWRAATLLCVTHDIEHALGFDRVVVMEGGRVVEQGPPDLLASQPDGHLRAMLDAETHGRGTLERHARWRRLRLEGGRLELSEPRGQRDG
jgi:ABC-type bacteriocin/lantibiotic exporter with double-glycine peptidase domain